MWSVVALWRTGEMHAQRCFALMSNRVTRLASNIKTSSIFRHPRRLAGGLGGQGREARAPKKKKGGPAVVAPPQDDRYLSHPSLQAAALVACLQSQVMPQVTIP